MSRLPFPAALANRFAPQAFGAGNLALRFDRGMDGYDDDWKIPRDGAKEAFLQDFAKDFAAPPDFADFLKRRHAALAAVGAVPVDLTTRTRLVVGLGLPHPTETGFLLDRTTGSPYLPGSSLKGLLRAAAQDDEAWDRAAIERVFGPEIREGVTPKKGGGRFFDAFPGRWPKLEVDILTPHHMKWNDGEAGAVPADWEDPTPVAFLTVAPEMLYRFYLAVAPPATADDLARLQSLLPQALEQEGVGGKKSSGYGTFRRETWEGVRLNLRQGAAFITRRPHEATCRLEDLPQEAAAELARRRSLTVDVEVEPTGTWTYRIVRVLRWRA